eukprot:CAMPEP_0170473124 /NCGR_PEP_ID=MMETSP0123-20130129/15072_1 /TAXON_ID=182087 /ORGANISM="Favella ehrenbergii, Strain Fehren 1" /LENGTH=38 /DNA_ID= /DNA_START= /DNA_END= /DNA_ORIENTATION=
MAVDYDLDNHQTPEEINHKLNYVKQRGAGADLMAKDYA